MPEGVDHHRIDQRGHEEAEHQVGGELGPLGHSPRGDGYRRGREHHLEEEERGGAEPVAEGSERAAQEEAVGAEQRPGVGTEGDAVAESEEGQCADAHVGQVLGHDVADVLCSGQPSLEHAESGLHQEHQNAGDEHP